LRASKTRIEKESAKVLPSELCRIFIARRELLAHDRVNQTSTPSKGEAVMNPQTVKQSEQSPPSALPLGTQNPSVTPSVEPSATPKAADYAYRIALLTAGIVLLATVV
jgi:hypothetical protein